jgi:hypothetical protein
MAIDTRTDKPRLRYPGAHPFSDDSLSRVLFHGRDQESVALTNAIVANRLVVLFARSGLGKTSLLNAGVTEPLRLQGFLPLIVRLNNTDVGALESMYQGIEAISTRQSIEYKPGDKTSLWHFFKTAEFWSNDRLLEPVIILDQFEELFTLQSESHRSQFMDQLSYLVRGIRPTGSFDGSKDGTSEAMLSDSPPCAKVVLSLREDFLAYLEEVSSRIPGILEQRYRLLPLSREAAVKALLEPAAIKDAQLSTQPFEIDPQLTETVLDFLTRRKDGDAPRSSDSVEPFQLQLICQHLEEVASKKQHAQTFGTNRITLEDLGGKSKLQRILKDFYRRQIKALPFFQRSGVKTLLSESLISSSGRRLVMEESEIKALLGVKPATLQALVDGRLLRAEQTAKGKYYELSHDSLIQTVLHSRRLWFMWKASGIALILLGGILWILIAVFSSLPLYRELIMKMENELGMGVMIFSIILTWSLLLYYLWSVSRGQVRKLKAVWGRLRV